MTQPKEWITPELGVVLGSGDCPITSLFLARPQKRTRSCLLGATKNRQSPWFATPRDARLRPGLTNCSGANPHVGETMRDVPSLSRPGRMTSFPLTFGPTRIVIPLARYRKYGSHPASRYSSS